MPSPFPGMDPYLEPFWGDVHQALITYARDQLQAKLPRDLRARMQQRLVIDPGDPRAVYPDVHVSEPVRAPREAEGGVALAIAPAGVEVLLAEGADEAPELELGERVPEGYIEIREGRGDGRVVTVIEVLSPSNKAPGPDRDLYLRKRTDLAWGGVGLVEIDLLRRGAYSLMVPADRLPRKATGPYFATTWRPWRPWAFMFHNISLRGRLPRISIPLRPGEREVALDLQAILDAAYDNGRYDDLDYRSDPDPPLPPEDAAWADARLREAGRRGP
jgi:hypothetical protein